MASALKTKYGSALALGLCMLVASLVPMAGGNALPVTTPVQAAEEPNDLSARVTYNHEV